MMFKNKSMLLIAVLALPAGLFAEDTNCNGVLRGNHDNVIVQQGATCTLEDAVLTGSVYVKKDGAVTILTGVTVNGNVISEDGGRFVRIFGPGVWIGGNVQVKYNYEGSAIQSRVTINGSLQYVENTGELSVTRSFIGSDLQLFSNTGGAVLTGNTIRQNMQCKENVPPPTGGRNNAGSKQDQCARL